METKLVYDKGKDTWAKCGFADGREVPREGLSGGLILAWIPKLNHRVQYSSKNLVHTELLDFKGNPLSITFVYSQPNHSKREEVWQQLKNLKALAKPNWLCIGDFNQVLARNEMLSFTQGTIVGADMFQQVINELQFCVLEATRQRFTWMNNRGEKDFVMERLDRSFANVGWVNYYPHYAL